MPKLATERQTLAMVMAVASMPLAATPASAVTSRFSAAWHR